MKSNWKEMEDWMTNMDIDILMVLANKMVLTPTVIADNLDRSRSGVSNRLNTLEAGGMVERTENGKYKITWQGEKVLMQDPDEDYPEFEESMPAIDKITDIGIPEYRDPRTGEYVRNPLKYATEGEKDKDAESIEDKVEKIRQEVDDPDALPIDIDEEFVEEIAERIHEAVLERLDEEGELTDYEDVFKELDRVDKIKRRMEE